MMLSGTNGGFLSMNVTVKEEGTALATMNGNDQASSQNVTVGTLILLLLMLFIGLVGLTGNTVVLWFLGFRMQRNAFSVYILNLAGADFLYLCCQITLSLLMLIEYFTSIHISTHSYYIAVCIFAYTAGLYFLTIIGTERCLSVLWPIWYRCHRPRYMSAVMCALLWALSLLTSILKEQYCGFMMKHYPLVIKHLPQDKCKVLNLITTGGMVFLFVLLSGSSLALVTRLLCGSQRVPLTRLFVTVMLTVLVFLLCGLPVGIFWSILPWFNTDLYESLIPIFLVSHLLSCVNSCANPIIYFFVGSFRQRWRKGRQSLKLVLQRALQDFPEGDEHGGSLPQETLEMVGSSLTS